jgi:hypothetical protein
VIERRRHPIAHTRDTMNDTYLRGSATVATEGRRVVSAALRQQVDQARAYQQVPVFTAAFVEAARADPQSAAAEAGASVEILGEIVRGHRDTVVAACVDHLAGPETEPGRPCTASFLTCLDCRNSRALPHQLPIQVAVRDRITALRPNLDPAHWAARYGQPLTSLEEILGHYTIAQVDTARAAVTAQQRDLVEDLMTGRLDLR